jgi:hypothetical protein
MGRYVRTQSRLFTDGGYFDPYEIAICLDIAREFDWISPRVKSIDAKGHRDRAEEWSANWPPGPVVGLFPLSNTSRFPKRV